MPEHGSPGCWNRLSAARLGVCAWFACMLGQGVPRSGKSGAVAGAEQPRKTLLDTSAEGLQGQ